MERRIESTFVCSKVSRVILILTTLSTCVCGAFGQVVINEFMAAPSERLLQWSPAAFPPEPDTAWWSASFDDSSWSEAPGGFGYGDEGRYDYTVVNLQDVAVALYLRTTFTVSSADAALGDALAFTVDYDDGYVAYLNGVEISRRNLGRPGEPIPYSRVADAQHESGVPETDTLAAASALLVPGVNVLAIQVHNASLQSSDLALIADLAISGTPVRELVRHEDTWRYFIGTAQPPGLCAHLDFSSVARLGAGPSWTEPPFDDSSWNAGPGKVGFGHADVSTYVDVRMLATSLYFRRSFPVTPQQAARQDSLELDIDYDDGFVAYLNGAEVARRNLGSYGGFVYHDQSAYHIRQATGAETFTLPVAATDVLTAGTNVLAIQVHNVSIDDYDLALAADLRIPGSPPVELVRYNDLWKYMIGTQEPSGGFPDEDGEFSDWLEIYNAGSAAVSLNGWSLTDDAAQPAKWLLPDISLPGGEHLVIFASGKDRRATGGMPLHTNFKLGAEGEYLALYNAASPRQAVSEFSPAFPGQSPFHSYGRDGAAGYKYFDTPTPGGPNGEGQLFAGVVAEPLFSVNAGFYNMPFALSFSCETPDAIIRYATDGREPDPTASPIYTGPIWIDQSTVLRAKTFKAGLVPSEVVTQTYLLDQPEPLKSLPALSLVGDAQRDLFEPHGVLAIMGGAYGDISTWCSNCWIPQDLDDYSNPLQHGRPFERPVAVGYLDPANEARFAADCGIRLSGGSWIRYHLLRREDWTLNNAKGSFRFYFRGDYGESQLDFPLFPGSRVEQFDVLTLRGGLNDSENPFLKDELLRRLHIGMGHVGSHGVFVNLFVNGDYKNYYNLVERPDESFFQSWYESAADWDVLRGQHNLLEPEVGDGDTEKWNALFAFIDAHDLSVPAHYATVAALLDLENFVDYLLVNIYGATSDWPEANWVAARERSAGGIFRFYVWDAEGAFGTSGGDHKPVDYNSVAGDLQTTEAPISILYRELAKSADFRMLIADRIQKHFFGDSALTDASITARYLELEQSLQDVVEWVYAEEFDTSIRDHWIPQRRNLIFAHFAAAGWWPALEAPSFEPPSGVVARGTVLEIAHPNPSGSVYFTTNGSDPRAGGTGEVAATAQEYSTPLVLQSPLQLSARVRDGTDWSPLAQATFEIREASPGDIIITEFFADAAGDDTNKEWLELFNTTEADMDITGWSLADNDNDFHTIIAPEPVIVPAKGYLVLGETEEPSLNGGLSVDYAYGQALTLGNAGDEIILLQAGTPIHSIGYGAFKASPLPILTAVFTPGEKGAALGMADDYCAAPVHLWQVQSTIFGPGGQGTPGADNDGVEVCAADDTPPTLLSAQFARRDLLLLQFDEGLDPAGAEEVMHYSVGGGVGQPSRATLPLDHQVLLEFPAPLSSDVIYTVSVVGVSDDQGNPISSPQQASALYRTPRVSITEVMYNNRGADLEWIELFNPGGQPVDLSGWHLTDDDAYPAVGEGAVTLPPGTVIQPGEHLVVNLWNAPNFSLWQMPEGIRVVNPLVSLQGTLNNTGDNLALFDPAGGGILIDGSLSVAYPDLTTDGESIEKIDERFPWGNRETIQYNFRRAEAPLGFETGLNENLELLSERGTPGRPNGLWPATPSTYWRLY